MRTIANVLAELFPDGYPTFIDTADAVDRYTSVPALPFDVFAFTGHILELSGAYHHITLIGRSSDIKRRLEITSDDLRLVDRVASSWRQDAILKRRKRLNADLALLIGWWREVTVDCGREAVFSEGSSLQAEDVWWRPALLLFLCSDQASRGVGFKPLLGKSKMPWFEEMATTAVYLNWQGDQGIPDAYAHPAVTFSTADPDVLCVLPKARTPSVGCTMRSLSHNLALLPPRGVAKGGWLPFMFEGPPPDEMHMNILLVPFPFQIRPTSFKPRISEEKHGQSSGCFILKQDWLSNIEPKMMLEFIGALSIEAEKDVDRIHAVVFPEMALNNAFFEYLAEHLPHRLSSIELLVSGVSQDTERKDGNFVAMTVFQGQKDELERAGTRFGLTSRREKHHRWRLDRNQINAYGLEGVLSGSVAWWEDIDLLSRRVDFAVIRSGSVVSAMICEDLARVDPCQQLIRAIGPSIIFAILMDGPQLKARWPARHATTLAEDPGSAVLTLTSKGLMDRQNRRGIHRTENAKDRVIALWRDDLQSAPKEIECPDGYSAVVLSLSGARVIDRTLDGRTDSSAVSWRYGRHQALKLAAGTPMFAPIQTPYDTNDESPVEIHKNSTN